MVDKTLDALLAEKDDLGLLNVRPSGSKATSEAARVIQQFEEINHFIDRQGFAPGAGPAERKVPVNERSLQMRLKTYLRSAEWRRTLLPLDRHGLLAAAAEPARPEPSSLDEILSLDDDLLSAPAEEIYTFHHARPADIARPDKVSERKPCQDFDRFAALFDACAAELANGARKSMPFANEQDIRAGEFFVLNGITVFVAEVNDPHIRNRKRNARLRLVFENGTEGENLLRSLATELYKDPLGRRISEPAAGPLFNPASTTANAASPQERTMGCIYVVKSLSPLPEIRKLDGTLFKIGFTTGRFEERIAAAQDDPTFLLAPVHPVRTYDTINLNANKVENLLHRFFAKARLDLELKDRFGKPYRPREWFLLPIQVIERAITMLLDGSIVRYQYDFRSGEIVSTHGN
ncbi:GIY-YIG nuclease family protein [Rhodopila sp.]|uniref:GIY-YIG nuclease family protein n=1 Tax=Rhodopila sp. TaxID=2480087 RepID=UPI003D0E1F15